MSRTQCLKLKKETKQQRVLLKKRGVQLNCASLPTSRGKKDTKKKSHI